MQKPLISVLMPVRNAAPWLSDCLESLLAQSYTYWELLAVIDHSTDESGDILEAFAKRDSRITVHPANGTGIIPALRLAYGRSSGALITRMDADDLMPARKLELLLVAWQKQGEGCVATGRVNYISDGILQDGYRRYATWLNELQRQGHPFRAIYRECVIPSPAWLMHRHDLDRIDAFHSDRYPEDYDLVFRMYAAGLSVSSAQEVVHIWRDHPTRSSRTRPEYARQEYFKLKVPYFRDLDRDPDRPLVLWGAGTKGKKLARQLREHNLDFRWVCNTASKWGHQIQGIRMEAPGVVDEWPDPQIIVAVSGPDDQQQLLNQFRQKGMEEGRDFFFFV
jgi:glycosyltransferase involved in cell wall biosynthesis